MQNSESALVILVPEAEPLVGPVRERFDPSAAQGVPAHVTLLYPFIDPQTLNQSIVDAIEDCLRPKASFSFSLTTIKRFPDRTLYLAPEPDEPFRSLTKALWRRFPETPPYRGQWPDIIPHLSIGRFAYEAEAEAVSLKLVQAWKGKLPIRATARDVVLIDNVAGRWTTRKKFQLGG